jgi:large subunit ribosomal protein L22
MNARATAKYVRISSRKVARYGREVRNMPYREAYAVLNVTPARGARELGRVLQSAYSNLLAKSGNIDEDTVSIDEIIVNEGPTMKRWRPRARGRADRILKRTCHISVKLSGQEIEKK